MESFESMSAYLRKTDQRGRSLHDHLTDVLLHLAKEQPNNPVEVFEKLSAQLKKDSYVQPDSKEIPPRAFPAEAKQKALAYLSKVSSLIKPEKAKPADDEEPADEEEEPDLSYVPNIMEEARLLRWAGINLGDEETFKVLLSVKRLSAQKDFANVRFFGKFFGLQADYFVVEAKPKEFPESEESQDPMDKREKPGEGVNEYVYLVCNDLTGEWSQLPDLTPDQIIAARQMRKFLTGKLDAEVTGYPRFPWKEASYLRAQIARIAAATVVAPAGKYSVNEEDEEGGIIETEDYQGTPADDLKTLAGWVHHRPQLLKQGRMKVWAAPEKEEDEEAEETASVEKPIDEDIPEPEEQVERLRSIEADEDPASKRAGCWSVRAQPNLKGALHTVICASSLVWPGAVSVAQNKSFVNIYIGWGQKDLNAKYSPPPFPKILAEYTVVKPEDADEDWVNPLSEQSDPLPPPPEPVEPKAEEDGDQEQGDGDAEAEEDA